MLWILEGGFNYLSQHLPLDTRGIRHGHKVSCVSHLAKNWQSLSQISPLLNCVISYHLDVNT